MAKRRMFSQDVVDTDLFLDMPTSARLLYYDLGMRADDDGFVDNPKKIMRMTGASEDDFKVLYGKSFIFPFENGICVIRHWKLNNYIRSDRYNPTIYSEEKKLLGNEENGSYTLIKQEVLPVGIPVVNTGKVRLGKERLGKVNSVPEKIGTDILQEIIKHLNEKTGKHFKFTQNNYNLIRTRMRDGFSKEDFIKVIDIKCNEWLKDKKMNKYLQPSTLFGTKFENYLNQKIINDKPEWFDKEISTEQATIDEIKEMERLMSD